MSCSNEAHGHDHSHGHGHGHDRHDHDDPEGSGPQDSLYSQIDLPHVSALNAEGGAEAGQRAIKYLNRAAELTLCKYVQSDADETMIINIPFISSVSLRTITIKAGPAGQTPSALHLFKDSPGMDFGDAESREPTQKLEMIENRAGVEYQVKAAKFGGMTSLTIYIPGNTSDGEEDTTRMYYIGLRGSWSALPNRPDVIIYESAARPTDHKMESVRDGQTYRPGY